MKVSVALCTYNGEKYIEQQLNSILNQNYPVEEIQIGDDGSSDKTIDIIDSFRKKFDRLYLTINERRLGPLKNFENTIKRCRGQYICLADQDDIWYPEKLETVIPILERNDRIQACFSNAGLIDAEGHKIAGSLWEAFGMKRNDECVITTERLFESLLRFGNLVTGATVVFKSRSIDKFIPFNQRYDNELHDLIIARQLSLNNEILPLDKELMSYRVHDTQYAGIPNKKLWNCLFEIKKAILSQNLQILDYNVVRACCWNYYKSSINEIMFNAQKSSYRIKKCFIESQNSWNSIKKQKWTLYDNNIDNGHRNIKFSMKISVCYFIGYTETQLDENDLRYIDELRHYFDKVIVLTNHVPPSSLSTEYMLVENKGYDFGFLYQAIQHTDLSQCHLIGFVNNSNMLLKNKNLKDIFHWCYTSDSLFCGITDSYESPIKAKPEDSYHLQSHFLIFKDRAISLLRNFFSTMRFEKFFSVKNKELLRKLIIYNCEIGLTQYMIRHGIEPASWIQSVEFSTKYKMPVHTINLHSTFWEEIIKAGYPLIKKKIVANKWNDIIPNKQNINLYL